MDQEQPAAGDAANRGHRNEDMEAALVACRRDDEASEDVKAQGLGESNDFVTAAATAVAGARSEDQLPRQGSGNSGPRSRRVRTGATTASVAAAPARVRQHEGAGQAASRSLFEGFSDDEDVKARDMREFDYYIKMQLQQQQTQQLLTRLHQHPSPSSTEGGGSEVAPARASLHEEGAGSEVAPARASLDLDLRL
jgi:hypothetical protein